MNSLSRRSAALIESQYKGLFYNAVRCAGNKHSHAPAHHDHHDHAAHHDHGHGHEHHHHDEHEYIVSKHNQAKWQIPTQHDMDYQLPKKQLLSERLVKWLISRWPVDRDDILNNDRPNKWAAYYWFQNYSILQNKLILKLVQSFFVSDQAKHLSHHDSFNGVKTSENGLFLYKSLHGEYLLKSRFMDYTIILCTAGFITGISQFLLMPVAIAALSLPRKYAIMHYFTYHAELLPHTEQVVFHKNSFLGKTRRIYVDIANLEKVDADVVPSPLLWGMNYFDQNLVFRDQDSKEVFVFDTNGIWNQDTLNHKLIN